MSVLTSDIEMQNLELAQLVFRLALVQCFLTMLPSRCFGLAMYSLCHYMLEICDPPLYVELILHYSNEVA